MRKVFGIMFSKYRPLLLGGSVVAGATGFLVANCSSRIGEQFTATANSTGVHVCPPDFAPMSKWDFNWDRMDPRFLKIKVWSDSKKGKDDDNLEYPTARRNIILVRHGQYNQKGKDDDCHTLTKLGEEQAALAGKRLNDSGIKFRSVICSGMTRAIQTAEIILKQMDQPGLKLETKDPILNEGPPCIPEPPYPNPELWDPDFNEFYREGARIEAAFRKYFHRAELSQKEDSYELIVCHANVIRYFTMRALQFPPEGWLRISIDHTSLTKVSLLPNGDVVLRGLGDSGHLPSDKATA